jgi:hypothetical protein
MSSLGSRISKLEQQSPDKRFYVVTRDRHSGMVRAHESGNPEGDMLLTDESYEQWASQQPSSVMVIKIVYPDKTLADSGQ